MPERALSERMRGPYFTLEEGGRLFFLVPMESMRGYRKEASELQEGLSEIIGGFTILDEGRDKWHYSGLVNGDDIRRLRRLIGEE